MTTHPDKTCTVCNAPIAWDELLFIVERDGKDEYVCARCANAIKDVEFTSDVSDHSHGESIRKIRLKK